ncbi:hypothetical protein [Mesorhizobium sp. J428]|uniref:hypothetical protein n=1 Tax=Mesorhizobium sp. J428 TaxID=2898440 RepID=UPI002150E3A9|nr:hypothetical protein [Mesorhizobium sp. J428]MCR5858291.1 hypothetical protein [Mesorhizobium sp. J428]
MSLYINHAHNDFLEIILEGGLAAAALLVAYAVALSIRWIYVGRAALQRLVILSIAFIALHSMVDYPLRTMAVAITFAFMNALFFSTIGANASRSARPLPPSER